MATPLEIWEAITDGDRAPFDRVLMWTMLLGGWIVAGLGAWLVPAPWDVAPISAGVSAGMVVLAVLLTTSRT